MQSREDILTPALTIIIVTWNSWSDLRKCLDSIYASVARDYDVLVIDNASVDGTRDRLRELFPQVRLCENDTNIGHTRAVNQAFSLVRGEFALLLDVDTELPPDMIDRLMGFMAARPDVSLAAPRTLNTDGSVQESARNFPSVWNGLFGRQSLLTRIFPNNPLTRRYLVRDKLAAAEPFQVEWIGAACMMFRRELLDEVGLWDERYRGYWVDADWCMTLKRSGKRVFCVPDTYIMHHENNARGKKKSANRIRMFHAGAYHFYTKWYTLGVLDPRSLFCGLALSSRALILMILNLFVTASKADQDRLALERTEAESN